MSDLYDEDGQLDREEVARRVRSGVAVLIALAVLIGGGFFAGSKIYDKYIELRTVDDYIGEGTLDDIATIAGVSRKTAQWCARPAALRRIEERNKAWSEGGRRLKTRGSLVLVLVEEVDESRTG